MTVPTSTTTPTPAVSGAWERKKLDTGKRHRALTRLGIASVYLMGSATSMGIGTPA
jgi:hypothetical protein